MTIKKLSVLMLVSTFAVGTAAHATDMRPLSVPVVEALGKTLETTEGHAVQNLKAETAAYLISATTHLNGAPADLVGVMRGMKSDLQTIGIALGNGQLSPSVGSAAEAISLGAALGIGTIPTKIKNLIAAAEESQEDTLPLRAEIADFQSLMARLSNAAATLRVAVEQESLEAANVAFNSLKALRNEGHRFFRPRRP